MGMAGNYQKVPFDKCKCGKHGFLKESDLTRHMLNLRRTSEPVDKVKCPVGDCWHFFNPLINGKEAYLRMLTATAGHELQSKPVEPPGRLDDVPASTTAAMTAPAPASTLATNTPSMSTYSACAKVGYATEKFATVALRAVQEQGREEKRIYHCPQCGRWHLTSLEFDRSTVVEEELVAFSNGTETTVVMFAGRYPDGSLASIIFKGSRATIRIRPEHAAVVRRAIDYAIDGEKEEDPLPP